MVPSSFTVLDKIPTTINGKIDYKSLPEPDFIDENKYKPPRNELESKLCNLFEQVLDLEKVGIDDTDNLKHDGGIIKHIQETIGEGAGVN